MKHGRYIVYILTRYYLLCWRYNIILNEMYRWIFIFVYIKANCVFYFDWDMMMVCVVTVAYSTRRTVGHLNYGPTDLDDERFYRNWAWYDDDNRLNLLRCKLIGVRNNWFKYVRCSTIVCSVECWPAVSEYILEQ